MDALEQRIEELRAKEELDAIRPDLDGRQVMEHLGITPGPLVGEALRYLLELRLEEGPLGEEEATRRLDQWWQLRRPPAPPKAAPSDGVDRERSEPRGGASRGGPPPLED